MFVRKSSDAGFLYSAYYLAKTSLSESRTEKEERTQSQSVKMSILIGLSRRFCFRFRPSGSSLDREWRSHNRRWEKMETSWLFCLRFRRAHGCTYDSIFFIFTRSQALLGRFSIFDCKTLASKTSLYGGDARMKDLLHTFNEWKQIVETKFKPTWGAHNPERATTISSLCRGGCMDQFIFR